MSWSYPRSAFACSLRVIRNKSTPQIQNPGWIGESIFFYQPHAAVRELWKFMFCVCRVTILTSSVKSSISDSRASRSRKEETMVGLSRNPPEHYCAVEWSPRVLYRRVLPHSDITKTEGLHFSQMKSAVDGIKSLGKIKIDDINCVAFVHPVLHRFLEH